ncbi:MAG: hypothetical protein M1837_005189 [Sclerophora amabilis]|nr:MAG: hypothetical protein M1837_005189 [Sclerophora amabilis]
MRIRAPFAGAFVGLSLIAAYLGFARIQFDVVNDKALHFITFFILTICFYWVVDTSRRRNLNFTLIVCTLILGFGSEIIQGLLPNGRSFDPYDILANLLGSLSALGICSWYHKRMLDRKRQAKHYSVVPGDDDAAEDLELGEAGMTGQESGLTPGTSLEEEIDNWDENAEDNWDEEEVSPPTTMGTGTEISGGESIGGQKSPDIDRENEGSTMMDGKKRDD